MRAALLTTRVERGSDKVVPRDALRLIGSEWFDHPPCAFLTRYHAPNRPRSSSGLVGPHRVDPDNPDADRCRIKDGTKNGEQRAVTIPPHVREDVKAHLAAFVGKSADALLFTPR